MFVKCKNQVQALSRSAAGQWVCAGALGAVLSVAGLSLAAAQEKVSPPYVLYSLQVTIDPNEAAESVEAFWGEGVDRFSAMRDELVEATILVPAHIAEALQLEARSGFPKPVPNEAVLAVSVIIDGSKKGSNCRWEAGDYVCDSN